MASIVYIIGLVLITSWIGLAVYFLWAKNHVTEWFK